MHSPTKDGRRESLANFGLRLGLQNNGGNSPKSTSRF